MVNCPRCGSDATKYSKEWDYRDLHVKYFQCSECDKSFKAYYKEGKLSYTIPKKK